MISAAKNAEDAKTRKNFALFASFAAKATCKQKGQSK